MYQTHRLIGVLLGLVIYVNFNLDHKILFFTAILLGSIFVDIDEPRSFIGRKLKLLSWPIKWMFGHRGIFHSMFMALLLSALIYHFLEEYSGIGFFVGYLGHIIADGITLSGVKIFYPLSKVSLKGFIRTGGMLEKLLFFVLLIVTIWTVIKFVL